jgi:UDP-N-acetylglucosamine 1-carboxyvinyltransferase
VDKLHGGSFRIMPDYIESASFIAAAAATRGSIKIENTEEEDFLVLQRPFSRLGVQWTRDENGVLTFDSSKCEMRISSDVSGAIAKIDDGIWPAVPSDLLSVLIVLATQVDGIVLFFEKMFESRLYFIDNLIGMGAHIVQCDPHRIVVHGSGARSLKSTRMLSPDIRAGMALVLAGLCAEGTTYIGNAESIDRGYESLEKSLSDLGADIKREIISE